MKLLQTDVARIILIICLTFHLNAESFYVDNARAGNGDGTSWASAWNSIGNINWAAVNPGDVIFISGGTNSKTYSGSVSLNSTTGSGTAASPIVIRNATDVGHNGSVIIDGGSSRGINLNGANYLTIRGLEFRNASGSGGGIIIDRAQGVVVDSCSFYITSHGGVFVQRSSGCTISNNTLTTPANTGTQTDGIYSQRNNSNTYDGNHIVISNQAITPHCDGIQMFLDRDMVVRNNYIEQNNDKTYNAQGIYSTNCSGTIEVYNNVIYGPNTWNSLLTVSIISEGDARLVAYHNTFIGGGWGTIAVEQAPHSIVKNNILVNFKNGGWLIKLNGALSSLQNLDYNIYYAPNSGIVTTYNEAGRSWSQWQGLGYDQNGMNTDPKIQDAGARDFTLQETASIIDRGTPLDARYNLDRNNVPRPQNAGWDPGAYEFSNNQSTDTTPPQAPQNLRIGAN